MPSLSYRWLRPSVSSIANTSLTYQQWSKLKKQIDQPQGQYDHAKHDNDNDNGGSTHYHGDHLYHAMHTPAILMVEERFGVNGTIWYPALNQRISLSSTMVCTLFPASVSVYFMNICRSSHILVYGLFWGRVSELGHNDAWSDC
jgi:hypothetical protein